MEKASIEKASVEKANMEKTKNLLNYFNIQDTNITKIRLEPLVDRLNINDNGEFRVEIDKPININMDSLMKIAANEKVGVTMSKIAGVAGAKIIFYGKKYKIEKLATKISSI